MKIKVALGLSGGVDSAVAAYLLKKQGFDISGVYLNCFDEDIPGCRGKQDRQDALAVALHLKIPFQVLDFRKQYKAAVIGYFKKEYLAGRTPNPDVICNRDIKFGLFLDWAIKSDFDYVATGHYAKVVRAKGRKNLARPKDERKDQTYFLWAVPREKFKRVLFPLGNLLKTEVREIALKIGLPVAQKKDSTGICFVGEVRVEDFLKRLGVKEKIGEVIIRITKDYKNYNDYKSYGHEVIGRHRGVWFYTIGQRHGFEITGWPVIGSQSVGSGQMNRQPTNHKQKTENRKLITDKPPLYVISKDVRRNRLVVGFGADCYRSQFQVGDCNWLIPNTEYQIPNEKYRMPNSVFSIQNSVFKNCLVRIRHLGDLMPCQLSSVSSRKLEVALAAPARGVAPGQSAVFYSQAGIVLGGGIIQ